MEASDLDALEAAVAKMTGEPWVDAYPGIETAWKVKGGRRYSGMSPVEVLALEWGYYDDCNLLLSDEDKAGIIALRNAAPALIALARKALSAPASTAREEVEEVALVIRSVYRLEDDDCAEEAARAVLALPALSAPVVVEKGEPTYTFDAEHRTLYVYLYGRVVPVDRTTTLRHESPSINVDFDKSGCVVGVEVLMPPFAVPPSAPASDAKRGAASEVDRLRAENASLRRWVSQLGEEVFSAAVTEAFSRFDALHKAPPASSPRDEHTAACRAYRTDGDGVPRCICPPASSPTRDGATCPRCGSDSPAIRLCGLIRPGTTPHAVGSAWKDDSCVPCSDPWHDTPSRDSARGDEGRKS